MSGENEDEFRSKYSSRIYIPSPPQLVKEAETEANQNFMNIEPDRMSETLANPFLNLPMPSHGSMDDLKHRWDPDFQSPDFSDLTDDWNSDYHTQTVVMNPNSNSYPQTSQFGPEIIQRLPESESSIVEIMQTKLLPQDLEYVFTVNNCHYENLVPGELCENLIYSLSFQFQFPKECSEFNLGFTLECVLSDDSSTVIINPEKQSCIESIVEFQNTQRLIPLAMTDNEATSFFQTPTIRFCFRDNAGSHFDQKFRLKFIIFNLESGITFFQVLTSSFIVLSTASRKRKIEKRGNPFDAILNHIRKLKIYYDKLSDEEKSVKLKDVEKLLNFPPCSHLQTQPSFQLKYYSDKRKRRKMVE